MPGHLIGLLLGAEEDWPQAFEAIPGGWAVFGSGVADHVRHRTAHIAPFDLRDKVASSW